MNAYHEVRLPSGRKVLKPASAAEQKQLALARITANRTYLTDSGLVKELTKGLARLTLAELGQLQTIIDCRVAEAEDSIRDAIREDVIRAIDRA